MYIFDEDETPYTYIWFPFPRIFDDMTTKFKLFDVMMNFLTSSLISWHIFDVMTNFFMTWSIFDDMTNFWIS